MSEHRPIAVGISAGLAPGLVSELARRCADRGLHSLWSNDAPDEPGLTTLGHAAAAAPQLELGVGVMPLDRNPPAAIAAAVRRSGVDPARLWIGIGSGGLERPIAAVEQAVAELRATLPDGVRLVVAAMRPRMCRLAGALADGVLLNWMPPDRAARARAWVHEGAEAAGRPAPPTAAYVRVAVGPGAPRRLVDEERAYRQIDANHRRHFAALDAPLGAVGVAARDPAELADGLAPHRASLDLPIARILAEPTAPAVTAAADAVAAACDLPLPAR